MKNLSRRFFRGKCQLFVSFPSTFFAKNWLSYLWSPKELSFRLFQFSLTTSWSNCKWPKKCNILGWEEEWVFLSSNKNERLSITKTSALLWEKKPCTALPRQLKLLFDSQPKNFFLQSKVQSQFAKKTAAAAAHQAQAQLGKSWKVMAAINLRVKYGTAATFIIEAKLLKHFSVCNKASRMQCRRLQTYQA